MIATVHAEKQRIDGVFSLVGRLGSEEEVLAHWARYLCVLASGLIENGLKLIFGEYARTHARPEVANYVVQELEHATNFNTQKVRELVGAFSAEWRQAFDTALTDEQKDALDSITANRHGIAHGRMVGISLVRMREYYRRACEVLEWVSGTVMGS